MSKTSERFIVLPTGAHPFNKGYIADQSRTIFTNLDEAITACEEQAANTPNTEFGVFHVIHAVKYTKTVTREAHMAHKPGDAFPTAD